MVKRTFQLRFQNWSSSIFKKKGFNNFGMVNNSAHFFRIMEKKTENWNEI